jgi:hypothetical protein
VSAINRGAGVQLITTELTRGQLAAITGDLLVQGAPVSDWISRQGGDTLKRFQDNMRLGIAQGETNGQLIRRIRGGKQNGEVVEGFMKITRAHADSLVRSATQAVSQASRQAVYEDNDELVKGEQWVSTIDLRTTVMCSARDGLLYTVGAHNPIDHSLPWGGGPGNLHWGCRSTSTPVLKSFRELGLGIDEIPETTRASLDGQIPQDTTFEGWLSRRTVAEQNENLGVGRAQLWRDGKISFRDLMDANGRELTLQELRALGGGAAARSRTSARTTPTPTPKAPQSFAYQDFKGVTSVAQAEAYLTENNIAVVANIKGLSPKGISQAVGAAHEVTERFGLNPLEYMGPISRDTRHRYPKIKNANASVFWKTRAMHLPTKFGDLKDADYQIAAKARVAGKYEAERAARLAASTRIDDDVRSRVKKMSDGEYTWSITMADGASERAKTMYHEYGHVLHKVDETLGPIIDNFLRFEKPRLGGWDLLASKYAGANDAEYVAETFAIYMAKPNSEHYRIHPKLLGIFREADRKK